MYKTNLLSRLDEMKAMRARGESLRSIASAFGVSAPTVARYLTLAEAETKPAAQEDLDAMVEEALFKACVGYSAEVIKNHKVKKVEFDQQTGKKISEKEEIVEARDRVHVPPSIMAQRFYLTSRMPEKWGGKALADAEEEEAGIILLPEIAGDEGFDR